MLTFKREVGSLIFLFQSKATVFFLEKLKNHEEVFSLRIFLI